MEFTTIEQFREQPIEVQKIFLDWWECDYGDLYYYNEDPHEYKDVEIIDNNLECDLNGDFDYFKSIGPIPLFTEGQLRKFIEDKTNGKVESYYAWDYYTIAIRDTGCGGDDPQYDTEETNLLQVYWKVACIIAEEKVQVSEYQ
ncbi:hypothetical protein [Clostridium septicum]|uniref:Uncharacterized protein n=1 Tax=Clostridium septicum TaxID=1504 RepID=A0A9N7PK56_CLOSE|nr:hypothetical protein [Clostridium septicum]AYE35295.1 hypothetical protein CP523_13150 [Clostridium septicum]QAS60684.1 hypothetical protein EI377_07995 [Clostridium septicum]UEC20052.1 hypothetical protein LK444_11635 [Clostridium septicum]USS01892.1 hypothetical protein NH397_05535 [Clostridium septicum]